MYLYVCHFEHLYLNKRPGRGFCDMFAGLHHVTLSIVLSSPLPSAEYHGIKISLLFVFQWLKLSAYRSGNKSHLDLSNCYCLWDIIFRECCWCKTFALNTVMAPFNKDFILFFGHKRHRKILCITISTWNKICNSWRTRFAFWISY